MGCTQSTSATEPVEVPPASNTPVETEPKSAPASQPKSTAREPEAESPPSTKRVQRFKVDGISITEVGVVFYLVVSVDGSISVKRRYNDFKNLYAELGHPTELPSLPQGGLSSVFRGKHNQELIKEREAQFSLILSAISDSQTLVASPAFQKFLTASA